MKIEDIKNKKKNNQKISMLTAYDYPFASIVDKSGIDIILIGDSVANVVLGLDSTLDVGMTEMIHHSKAVARGVKNALIVGDMPYEAYQKDSKTAVYNAKRFVKEAGCNAVKLEWFKDCLNTADEIIKEGIPVMGHIGLTPQTAEELGGFKVQGKDAESADKLIKQARRLEKIGCFSIILECVPSLISKLITESVSIPTIGIGAGVYCDGQVLVLHDLIGLFDKHRPKFVKQYVNAGELILNGIKKFKKEVEASQFPDEEHSYHINIEELNKLKN